MKIETMAQRHTYILDKLNKYDFVRISDLAKWLGVSLVTIRKDVTTLETKQLLYKAHGEVYKIDPYSQDVNVNEKYNLYKEEKERIGEYAASLIKPNDAILIASGTTVLHMANAIKPQGDKLTVVTSAMNVSMALRDRNNIEIMQLGGTVRSSSTSVVGPYAEKMLKDLAVSTLFLGVDGIEPEYGCSTSNMQEAQLNRAMMHAAQKTIVLTDSTKFGKRGFGKICELADIDQIITDDKINPILKQKIERAGVKVVTV